MLDLKVEQVARYKPADMRRTPTKSSPVSSYLPQPESSSSTLASLRLFSSRMPFTISFRQPFYLVSQ